MANFEVHGRSRRAGDAASLAAVEARLKAGNVRVHVVHLAAESFVVRAVAERSRGSFAVALDRAHLDRLLARRVPPPALDAADAARVATRAPLVEMGFPGLRSDAAPQCAAGRGLAPVWAATTYACPRCATRVATVPCDCPVCDLPLVAAPHLARSYHHLFPAPAYVDVAAEAGSACFGCRAAAAPDETRFRCPECRSVFCADCDDFVHTALHNCPGCVGGRRSAS